MFKGSSADIDLRLLKLVRKGDENAFRQLYESTYGRVALYLRRLVADEHTVENILAETYVAVWKGAAGFQGKAQVTTWIIGIARNIAMNELRKFKHFENLDDHFEIPDNSLADVELFDRPTLIQEALLKLSAKHREILDLVFFHEMNYPEVSALLDVPVSTVKTRVFYAKDALKEVLGNMGVGKHDL